MIKRCLTSLFATLMVCFLACSSASARVCFLPDSTDCGEGEGKGDIVGSGNVEVPCQYSSCPAYNPKYQECYPERIYNNGGVNVECKQVRCKLSKSECEEQEDNPNSTQCCNLDSASGCYYMGKCPVLCNRNIYDSTTALPEEDYNCPSCKDKNGTFYNCTAIEKGCKDIKPVNTYTDKCSDSQTPVIAKGIKDSQGNQCYTCKDKPINQTTCHIKDVSTEQENWENCKYELTLSPDDSTIPSKGIDIKAGTSVRVWAKARGSSTISDIKGAIGDFQRSAYSGFKDFVCEAGKTYLLYATCGSFKCEEFQLTEKKDENCWYCDDCPDNSSLFQCQLKEKPGYKWDYSTNTCKEETCNYEYTRIDLNDTHGDSTVSSSLYRSFQDRTQNTRGAGIYCKGPGGCNQHNDYSGFQIYNKIDKTSKTCKKDSKTIAYEKICSGVARVNCNKNFVSNGCSSERYNVRNNTGDLTVEGMDFGTCGCDTKKGYYETETACETGLANTDTCVSDDTTNCYVRRKKGWKIYYGNNLDKENTRKYECSDRDSTNPSADTKYVTWTAMVSKKDQANFTEDLTGKKYKELSKDARYLAGEYNICVDYGLEEYIVPNSIRLVEGNGSKFCEYRWIGSQWKADKNEFCSDSILRITGSRCVTATFREGMEYSITAGMTANNKKYCHPIEFPNP